MSLDSHSSAPAKPVAYKNLGLRAGWNEHIVTAVAAGLGVLIVALSAVLMGMT